MQILGKNRLKYPHKLNINSLRNKIGHAGQVIGKLSWDESFQSAQFNISNYEIRNRRVRDRNGGGLIKLLRKGFITKRLKDYETQICETTCSEFTASKKKMDFL